MPLDDLAEATNKVVGTKETTKAVQFGEAKVVFIAEDADEHVTAPLIKICEEKDIPFEKIETMKELGRAAGIEVGAAAAAVY